MLCGNLGVAAPSKGIHNGIAAITRTKGRDMRRRDFIRLGARLGTGLAAIYAAGPTAASAQSYPARPVKLVVPYPPGGVVDVVARHWAEKGSASALPRRLAPT